MELWRKTPATKTMKTLFNIFEKKTTTKTWEDEQNLSGKNKNTVVRASITDKYSKQ